MKNIKKLVLTVMVCAMGVFSALAQNDKISYYNSGDFGFNLATAYTLEEGFNKSFDFNLEVGSSYFFTRWFGIEATLPFYSNHDVAVDRVGLGLLVRLPINRFALQVGGGSEYLWGNKDFNYYGVGGVSYRINPKVELFTQYRYKIQNFDNTSLKNGQGQLRAGVGILF